MGIILPNEKLCNVSKIDNIHQNKKQLKKYYLKATKKLDPCQQHTLDIMTQVLYYFIFFCGYQEQPTICMCVSCSIMSNSLRFHGLWPTRLSCPWNSPGKDIGLGSHFPLGGSDGEESACNAGNPGSIPGSGRSPGEGNGNPLQHSCLEDPMGRGVWWATVHGVTKSRCE